MFENKLNTFFFLREEMLQECGKVLEDRTVPRVSKELAAGRLWLAGDMGRERPDWKCPRREEL